MEYIRVNARGIHDDRGRKFFVIGHNVPYAVIMINVLHFAVKAELCAVDGGILGKGRIDYAKVLNAYREIGFFGTQVIEGSIDSKLGYEESIRQDAAYMRSI